MISDTVWTRLYEKISQSVYISFIRLPTHNVSVSHWIRSVAVLCTRKQNISTHANPKRQCVGVFFYIELTSFYRRSPFTKEHFNKQLTKSKVCFGRVTPSISAIRIFHSERQRTIKVSRVLHRWNSSEFFMRPVTTHFRGKINKCRHIFFARFVFFFI